MYIICLRACGTFCMYNIYIYILCGRIMAGLKMYLFFSQSQCPKTVTQPVHGLYDGSSVQCGGQFRLGRRYIPHLYLPAPIYNTYIWYFILRIIHPTPSGRRVPSHRRKTTLAYVRRVCVCACSI